MVELEAAAAEAVGLDHVRAGLEVAAGDGFDLGRPLDAPEFRAFAGGEPLLLEEGAPCAVGDELAALFHDVGDAGAGHGGRLGNEN